MKLSKLQNKLSQSDSYTPAEDTFFFADYLKNEKGEGALDIGTGSGYLAKLLSTKFSFVVGTDINYSSLKSQNPKFKNCVCCNGADALLSKFDLVVCNMPYLPSNEIDDITIDGGKDGLIVPIKIIESVKDLVKKGGRFLFLTSSLADYEQLMNKTESFGFKVRIIALKNIFFEKLILIEAKKI